MVQRSEEDLFLTEQFIYLSLHAFIFDSRPLSSFSDERKHLL